LDISQQALSQHPLVPSQLAMQKAAIVTLAATVGAEVPTFELFFGNK